MSDEEKTSALPRVRKEPSWVRHARRCVCRGECGWHHPGGACSVPERVKIRWKRGRWAADSRGKKGDAIAKSSGFGRVTTEMIHDDTGRCHRCQTGFVGRDRGPGIQLWTDAVSLREQSVSG